MNAHASTAVPANAVRDSAPSPGRPAGLRIAMVASAYLPDAGGVEEHTRHAVAGLRALGHEVDVLTVAPDGRARADTVDGVPVHRLPAPLPTRSPGGVARFLRSAGPAALAWRTALRPLRPDVVHVQCFGPNGVYALGAAVALRVPLLVSLHGETFMDDHDAFGDSVVLRTALRAALGRAHAVTACSQLVLDDAAERFGLDRSRATVVRNGVPPEEGDDPVVPPVPFTNYVLGVGRLVHNKGFDLLIEAFERIREQVPGLGLVIAGDGPARPRLEQLAGGLGGAVHFTGRLTPAQVAHLMRRCDVFVMPSRIEPFGMVVLEAWRAGRPVVASRRGGPAEYVRDGVDAVLVDPTDVTGLATAVAHLAADGSRRRRLGDAGRERVAAFGAERVSAAYAELYDRITTIARRPGGPR